MESFLPRKRLMVLNKCKIKQLVDMASYSDQTYPDYVGDNVSHSFRYSFTFSLLSPVRAVAQTSVPLTFSFDALLLIRV